MYPYRDLDSSRREIRVLRWITSEDENDDRVRCTLLHISLDESPKYDALSYTWGAPEPSQAIVVDGVEVSVGPNLLGALKRFRALNRLLWVDSLCINQNDQQERTGQVYLMGEIFKLASVVFMWLGDEKDNSDAALRFLNNLQQKFEAVSREAESSEASMMFKDQAFDESWNAISKIFQRPYWSRVWIVQEVLLANNPIVCCGMWSCSWRFIQSVMFHFDCYLAAYMSEAAQKVFVLSSTELTRTLARLNNQRLLGKKMSLVECLALSRQRQATDSRDHIYGMLNLVESYGIVPDYTISANTLCRDTAQRIIEQDKNLDILSACLKTTVPFNGGKTPSWVPDWTLSAEGLDFMFLVEETKCQYRASKETVARTQFDEEDSAVLTVEGFILDEVLAMSPKKSFDDKCEDYYNNLLSNSTKEDWAIWESMKPERCPYGDLSIQELAFERTLCLGKDCGSLKEPILSKLLINQGTKGEEAYAKAFPDTIVQKYLNVGVIHGQRVALSQRFAVTKKGYMGRGPMPVREGDIVAILFGAKVPFMLRKFKDHYVLLGECYIHGVMDGEAMDALDRGMYEVQEFRLQ